MCESEDVTVSSISTEMANTGEFFCHSIKSHDLDSPSDCLRCDWTGIRNDLIKQNN